MTIAMPRTLRILRPSCVLLRMKARSKEEAIDELMALLEKEGLLGDPARVRADVLAREKQASTGLTEGLAIPHARTPGAKELAIALGLQPEGIEFASLDAEPARAIFLIVSPEGLAVPYLQCLAEISAVYAQQQARERLLKARRVDEALAALGCA